MRCFSRALRVLTGDRCRLVRWGAVSGGGDAGQQQVTSKERINSTLPEDGRRHSASRTRLQVITGR